MQNRMIAIIAAIAISLTIIAALVAPMLDTQSTITLDNVTYTNTANGLVVTKDVEYIQAVALPAPMPINVVTPKNLPNTSAPHGSFTCSLTDQSGNTFDVTQSTPCENL